jgi:hypothetical protein
MKTAVTHNAVNDAEIIQDLQGPRLKTLASGADKVRGGLVHEPEIDVATGKIASECKPGRAGPNNQDRNLAPGLAHQMAP